MAAERLNRRRFLGGSVSGLVAVRLYGGIEPKGRPGTDGTGNLAELLQNSPLNCRPMTRWWWYGGAVEEKEISRELESMRDAGIGGAEIQPVYPLAVDDPVRGIVNVPFFSARWYDLLGYAVRRGHELGLRVELTLGSGWPFGGPFIELGEAARRIRMVSREVTGPGNLVWDLNEGLGEGRAGGARRRHDGWTGPNGRPASILLSGDDLKKLGGPGLPVNQGQWRLYAAVNSPTYMQVKRPTLEMEGYVLDHFSREPLEFFLKATGQRTLDELDARGIAPPDGFFCDSLEVFGADWTGSLLDEFRKRRGYDLSGFLHLLVETAGGMEGRVRHDYHLTLSELTLENFFLPLAEWCRSRKIPSRVQAHGAMGDILRAYGSVDVPEGETIFGGDVNRVNIRHRRLASSAAHLYSKPLVSAETYTWLRTPIFMANLEMMKGATDAAFLDGINQIVNHGYSYSPPSAGRPGWSFYASTHISPANTWWPHYHHLSEYVRRCASLLREGEPVNRVGIYVPLSDIFSSRGIGGFHLDEAIEERLGQELVGGLRAGGFDFDFLNDDSLQNRARIESARIVIGQGRYEAIVLPEVQFIPVETFQVLADFVRAGGRLIFLKRCPDKVPGMSEVEEIQRELDALRGAMGIGNAISGKHGSGRWAIADGIQGIVGELNQGLVPDLVVRDDSDHASEVPASAEVGFVRRRLGETDLFFLSNIGAGAKALTVQCGVGHRRPVRLDPMTLARSEELIYRFGTAPSGGETTEVVIDLAPFESCFIEFSSERPPLIQSGRIPRTLSISEREGRVAVQGYLTEPVDSMVTSADGRVHRIQGQGGRTVPLPGPWTLDVDGVSPQQLGQLVSWADIPALHGFSGWGTYTSGFNLENPASETRWFIDLGEVFDTAEVEINGRRVGDAWMRPRVLECTEALNSGTNRIRIRVANVWIHHVLAAPKPDYSKLEASYGIRWGRYGEVPPESIPPSGLLGPVRLVSGREYRKRLT